MLPVPYVFELLQERCEHHPKNASICGPYSRLSHSLVLKSNSMRNLKRRYRPLPKLSSTQASKFWSHVTVANKKDCWPWLRAKLDSGYGVVGFNYKTYLAHRIAYSLQNNVGVPYKKVVAHKCDNPTCCNPHHLFLTDQSGNLADMRSKNRGNQPIGSRIWSCRLTPKQVVAMRAEHVPWVISYAVLAKRYGVPRGTIQAVIERKSWKYL